MATREGQRKLFNSMKKNGMFLQYKDYEDFERAQELNRKKEEKRKESKLK